MQGENQEGQGRKSKKRKPGLVGRLRGALDTAQKSATSAVDTVDKATGGRLGAAKERVSGTVDTVTGIEFRRQFEDFTNVVTDTVIGVHKDQAGLRDTLAAVQQDQVGLKDTLATVQQNQAGLKDTLATIRQDQAGLKDTLARLEKSSNRPWWQCWHWRWW